MDELAVGRGFGTRSWLVAHNTRFSQEARSCRLTLPPTLVRLPKFLRHKRCSRGAVDRTALGLTPSKKGIDVDIHPLGGHARQSRRQQRFLSASEPFVVGVIEFVAIRRQLPKTRPLFSPVPCEPSDHIRPVHVYLVSA